MIAVASTRTAVVVTPAAQRRAALARRFLEWFDAPTGRDWLEIGCGDGVWTQAILDQAKPRRLLALDNDPARIAEVRRRLAPRGGLRLEAASATALPLPHATRDVALGQLGFAGVIAAMRPLAEILRVLRPGGWLGICVWDDDDEASETVDAPLPTLARQARRVGFAEVETLPLPAGPISAWAVVARA